MADYFDWRVKTDRLGYARGIFTTTPYPITEDGGITSYSITNDEGEKTFTLGTKYYVDGAAADDTGNGAWATPFKTIEHALTDVVAGNKIIIVRGAHDAFDGAYHETNLGVRAGTDDTHRYMIVGYGQERPVIDGDLSITVLITTATNSAEYFTLQRMKLYDNNHDGMRVEQAYVNVIDVECEQVCMNKDPLVDAYGDGFLHYRNPGANNGWVYHCTGHRTYGHGIKIADGAHHNTIEWNIVYECGWWSGYGETEYFNRHAIGINFPNHNPTIADANVVRYNKSYDTLFYNISINSVTNFSCHHNECYDSMRCADAFTDPIADGYNHCEGFGSLELDIETDNGLSGQCYSNHCWSSHGNSAGAVWCDILIHGSTNNDVDLDIYNNILTNDAAGKCLIDIDDKVAGAITFSNNSLYLSCTGTLCREQTAPVTPLYTNNIFWQVGTGTCMTMGTHTYNRFYYPAGTAGVVLDGTDSEGDPNWVAIPAGEYASGEAALTAHIAGTNLAGTFSMDFLNHARSAWDVGAIEYGVDINPWVMIYG